MRLKKLARKIIARSAPRKKHTIGFAVAFYVFPVVMTWLNEENENWCRCRLPQFSLIFELNRMAPTQKRKADDGPSSPNTKRARKKVVNELAEKVYAIQLLDSRHEFSSNCAHSHRIFVYYVRRIWTRARLKIVTTLLDNFFLNLVHFWLLLLWSSRCFHLFFANKCGKPWSRTIKKNSRLDRLNGFSSRYEYEQNAKIAWFFRDSK